MKSVLFIFFLFKSVSSFILFSNVGVGWPILEEDRKFVVYLLPFQIDIICYVVQE